MSSEKEERNITIRGEESEGSVSTPYYTGRFYEGVVTQAMFESGDIPEEARYNFYKTFRMDVCLKQMVVRAKWYRWPEPVSELREGWDHAPALKGGLAIPFEIHKVAVTFKNKEDMDKAQRLAIESVLSLKYRVSEGSLYPLITL